MRKRDVTLDQESKSKLFDVGAMKIVLQSLFAEPQFVSSLWLCSFLFFETNLCVCR